LAKTAQIQCEYQPYIDAPPREKASLYGQACSNDKPTVDMWAETWIRNAQTNFAKYGSFRNNSIGTLWGKWRNKGAIVIGSGPSLKENAAGLLKKDDGIPVISCLHNFHFLEDLGVKVDYYVSLDAGAIVIGEVSEGGSKTPDEYWAMSKGKTLLCYIATDPGLLAKWQGDVLFFNCPVPDQHVMEETEKTTEVFRTYVSSGGNVLGAATYIAKAILGANPIAFMGADFSFSYANKFHGWDSKYDRSMGACLRVTDVYGNSVKTWQSYNNFKSWFDWVAESVPGLWINCTEGGTFGAYQTGNIRSVRQMDLADFIRMQSLCEETRDQCENPTTEVRKILF
jgi:hypothetical protein